jgi:hypothetical protein
VTLEKKDKDKDSLSLWSTIIGSLGLIFVFIIGGALANSDWKWANSLAPTILWLGIALQIFYMLLFVGNSKISKTLGGQLASQVFLAVLLWFLYTQASVSATSTINTVFGLSDTVFPLSHQVLTFLYLFILSKPLFWVLLIWGIVAILYYMTTGGDGTHKSVKTGIFAFSGFFIGLIALILIEVKFDEKLLTKKAYLIAHSLDFNENINCPKQDVVGKGVFLGPAQSRVVIDPNTPTMSWVEAVYANYEQLEDIKIPQSLEIYGCSQN